MSVTTSAMRLSISLPLALVLASCGSDVEAPAAGQVSAQPLANVPAPQGQRWSEMVTQTADGGYLVGNPDAPVKLLEFGAMSCPHCADFVENSFEPLMNTYVDSGRVSYELRFFLLNALDMPATLLATCSTPETTLPLAKEIWANLPQFFDAATTAGDPALQQAMALPAQQRFTRLGDLLGMTQFVTARGISRDQAVSCLSNEAKAEELANRVEAEAARYDITGTPTFLLNGSKIDALTWPQVETALQNAGAR
ncbi:thioredoxin domain-containing protein [Croceicoccus sp. F390]|uniref:Thioredoxin domain-containing protein n=1 Tax=Croceicoccus esteveae TaxID=3075597 RepID=A0ABU2ZDU5_9SPHN|nr:thioredoxin domain-containing protein [Croceicoccus sp. F390]MDT0574766.1 thioredoxin domain-containing protein [Croceicoccus sp. F390]